MSRRTKLQSHRRGRDGRREGGRGGGRAEGIRRANGPIESTWGTVRKCSRKVYKHNTLGQGRGRCCSSSHCNNSLPQKSIFRRGTAEAHAIHQGAKIALGQHRAPMRPQRQKRLAAFSGHRHKFVGQGQSVSHIRARRRASTRVFSSIALRATKWGGGQGINHGKETRPRATACSLARRQCASQRRTTERAESPPRPTRASKCKQHFLPLPLFSALRFSRRVAKRGAQQRSEKAQWQRGSRRKTNTDRHRQPSTCMHMHMHGSMEEEEGRKEKRDRRQSVGECAKKVPMSERRGAPCANAQGKSTNTTLWGKGGDGAAPPHIGTTPCCRRRVLVPRALQRRTRNIREQKSH